MLFVAQRPIKGMLENIKVCYWTMSKTCKVWGGNNMFPYFRRYLFCGGVIDGFCSTTKYSAFMISLDLQNRLISNSHWSTYYMCVEERDIVNCLLILQISYL